MVLDSKTLVAANGALAIFMALALLFYRINYKTYRGYGFWLGSTFCAALVYGLLLLRSLLPEPLSIVLTNGTVALALLLRLDGLVRFIRGDRLAKGY
jgi:hypothetical protein